MKYKALMFWRHTRYLLIPLFMLGVYLGVLQVDGNFHEAIPGELYRSAQLNKGDLTRYAKEYNIRSVLNLRGEHVGMKWYDTEVSEAKADGIIHVDFHMSSSKQLKKDEALALIEVMKKMPRPLLIHCQAGADRTGLAAALYVAGVKKGSEFDAEYQLSPIYGHVPLWFIKSYAMNRTFESLEPYLGYHDS